MGRIVSVCHSIRFYSSCKRSFDLITFAQISIGIYWYLKSVTEFLWLALQYFCYKYRMSHIWAAGLHLLIIFDFRFISFYFAYLLFFFRLKVATANCHKWMSIMWQFIFETICRYFVVLKIKHTNPTSKIWSRFTRSLLYISRSFDQYH